MTSKFCNRRQTTLYVEPSNFIDTLFLKFRVKWIFTSETFPIKIFLELSKCLWSNTIPPLIESSYMPASSFEPASTSNQVSSLISLALLFYLVIKPYLEIKCYLEIKRYLKMNHYLEMKCYLEIKQYLLAMFFWWRPSWKDQWLTMMKIDPENTACKIGTVANWPVNPFQKSCDPIKIVIWQNKWKKSQFFVNISLPVPLWVSWNSAKSTKCNYCR